MLQIIISQTNELSNIALIKPLIYDSSFKSLENTKKPDLHSLLLDPANPVFLLDFHAKGWEKLKVSPDKFRVH